MQCCTVGYAEVAGVRASGEGVSVVDRCAFDSNGRAVMFSGEAKFLSRNSSFSNRLLKPPRLELFDNADIHHELETYYIYLIFIYACKSCLFFSVCVGEGSENNPPRAPPRLLAARRRHSILLEGHKRATRTPRPLVVTPSSR